MDKPNKVSKEKTVAKKTVTVRKPKVDISNLTFVFNKQEYMYSQLKILTSKMPATPMKLTFINLSLSKENEKNEIIDNDTIRITNTPKGFQVLTGVNRVLKALEDNEEQVLAVSINNILLNRIPAPPKKVEIDHAAKRLSERFNVVDKRKTVA